MTLPSPLLPIGRRLVGSVVWLALICAGLAILVQTIVIQRQTTASFQAMTVELGRTHVPMLTHALWAVELQVLEQQLGQIAARPEVAGVLLESPIGVQLSAGRVPGGREPDATLSLPHPRGEPTALGTLRLYADPGQLQQAILRNAGQQTLEIALFTVLMCLLIGWRLRREVGKPLQTLAACVSQWTPRRAPPPAPLQRPQRAWHDEIDLLQHGFASLSESLCRYGQERDQAMADLAAERDRLDRRVEQRTATLQRINGYLDLFSRTLMRCIHLPAGGYHDALRQALCELGEHIGARGCGLATRGADNVWTWQVVWCRDAAKRCCSEGVELDANWQGTGWQVDPSRPGLRAYQLGDANGGTLLAMQGAPSLQSEDERRYQQMAAEMLFSLLERWEHACQLEATRQELEQLSRSDPLTGLANRRHFDERWAEEVRRTSRSGLALSVLMVDVDYFKAYNDRYGHGVGDECLAAVAACLRELFQRAGELPARLGGEEFAVLLPGSNQDDARQAAERLRQAIFDLELQHAGSPLGRVSVSIGHATRFATSQASLSATLLHKADQALYAAKAAGRNCVHGTLEPV